jgi:DNA-binding beta-propeller fold protein YncE/lysophospholipase L1-like esterase
MKLKALGVNLLVALGSLIALFVVLEIAARLVLPRPQTVLVDDVEAPTTAPTAEKEVRVRTGLGGYTLCRQTKTGLRLNPNIRMIIRNHSLTGQNVEVRTNALGYRGDDVPAKTEKDFRVLTLGDSITLSDYTPEEQTFPAYMERRLAQLGPARKDVRVINAGTGSIDLRSEFMILMETGLSTKPDIVVEALYLNDADVSFTLNAVTYPASVRWSRFLTFLLNRTTYLRTALQMRARQLDRRDEQADFEETHPVSREGDWHDDDGSFNREIVGAFNDWGYAWTNDAWRRMEETLTLMKQVAADHDAELYVVLLPVRHQVEATRLRDEPQQQFAQVTRRLGLRSLDLLPVLRKQYAADKKELYYDHCHMHPEGNELVGRAIAETLAAQSSKLHAIGVSLQSGAAATPGSLAPASLRPVSVDLLNRPLGMALAPDGGLAIADANADAIRRVTPDGRFVARSENVGLQQPNDAAFDAQGVMYVADTWHHRVTRFAADGAALGDLPKPADGGGYYAPRAVAVAPEGDVFVANTGRSRIERYDAHGKGSGWGKSGKAEGEFQEALSLLVFGGEVYVADYGNARVQVFTYDGRFLRSFAVPAWKGASTAYRPAMVCFRDRLYLSDTAGGAILIYSRRGEALGRITSPVLAEPTGLAVGKDGTLYVANLGNGQVAAIDLNREAPDPGRAFAPK